MAKPMPKHKPPQSGPLFDAMLENERLLAVIQEQEGALKAADILLDLILDANAKFCMDYYLEGDASIGWEVIQKQAEVYDEIRAALKGGDDE